MLATLLGLVVAYSGKPADCIVVPSVHRAICLHAAYSPPVCAVEDCERPADAVLYSVHSGKWRDIGSIWLERLSDGDRSWYEMHAE